MDYVQRAGYWCDMAAKSLLQGDVLGALFFADNVWARSPTLPPDMAEQAGVLFRRIERLARTNFVDAPLPTDNSLLMALLLDHNIRRATVRKYKL